MWASSLSLVALAATFLVSEVRCGVGGPEKDFHTFREVQVQLKDPRGQQAPIRVTEQGDGHHLGSLNLEIQDLEANPLFEVSTERVSKTPTDTTEGISRRLSFDGISKY